MYVSVQFGNGITLLIEIGSGILYTLRRPCKRETNICD